MLKRTLKSPVHWFIMKKKSLSPQTLWTITILLGTLLYAIVRYITFGEYGIQDIPLFILNKSVSWSSVILLFITIVQGPKERHRYFQYVRLLLIIHAGISLTLIAPGVYPKLFDGSRFSMYGGLALLTGIFSFIAFFYRILVPAQEPDTFPSKFYLTVAALVFLLFHTACIGLQGWFTPDQWNGSMPPITLLGFLTGLVTLILSAKKKNTLQ